MPITRSINLALNLAIIRYEGLITFENMRDHITLLKQMPGLKPNTKIIIIMAPDTDVSQVTGIDLQRISTISPMGMSQARHVIVAPDALAFGLSRMFAAQRLQEPSDINVVRTIAEACDLLHIEDHNLTELAELRCPDI